MHNVQELSQKRITTRYCGAASYIGKIMCDKCRSQWPRGQRRWSTAARLLRSWVRMPPVVWVFVCCECCVLSGRGLCDELITRPEESYRLWCVVVCDLETSRMRKQWPALGRSATKKNGVINAGIYIITKIRANHEVKSPAEYRTCYQNTKKINWDETLLPMTIRISHI